MIDFHTHILPGMDDGSRSVEQSIQMLRLEAEQGITDAALTPHFYPRENSPARFLQRRQAAWELLQRHLEAGMPRLHLGAEVQYFEGICRAEQLESLQIQGMGILLLEMPMCRWTNRMTADVLDLQGFLPNGVVLAHIERYLPMQDRGTVEQLLDRGIRAQANVSFFCDWRTQTRAMSMFRRGQIHFLGSDCHDMDRRRPNWDRLKGKLQKLEKNGMTINTLQAMK